MGIYSSLTRGTAEFVTRIADTLHAGPLRRMIPLQTFRYGVCGVVTYFIFDPAAYYLIYNYVIAKRVVHIGELAAVSPEIAALAAVFPLTFAVGFWLNRNVAFKRSPLRTRTQLFRYSLTIVGSIVLNYLLMKLFVTGCGFWPTPSKVLVSVLCTIYSYLAAKYFTFRNPSESQGVDKSESND